VISSRWSQNGTLPIPYGAAVTWCNGTTGCIGEPATGNSLYSTMDGSPGVIGVTALTNGNYVVDSAWNGALDDLGAVTWCDGAVGCIGTVTAGNSLIGSTAFDEVGGPFPVVALSNGDYVVDSNQWQSAEDGSLGAITWGDGWRGLVGLVSTSNSFVGTNTASWLGGPNVFAFANGDYVVRSLSWNSPGVEGAGAITLLRGTSPQTGTVRAGNSVIGNLADGGRSMTFDYDSIHDVLVVGKHLENVVTLLRIDQLFSAGFE
jgi:hypothetical protein